MIKLISVSVDKANKGGSTDMFTVKDLLKACQEQVDKGNGDKGILISRDDEGNGYHSLFYLFSEDIWEFTDPGEQGLSKADFGNCIILG